MSNGDRREFLRNSTAAALSLAAPAGLIPQAASAATLVLPSTVISDGDPVGLHNSADRGSDRGSGFWQSNTILRHCEKLFATWQGYDPISAKYTVWVRTNHLGTGLWSVPVAMVDPPLVPGWLALAEINHMDEHGGASLIADKSGYLHLLYGPHHAPMLEAVSTNPWDASAFNFPRLINTAPWTRTTYSSVVRDSSGMLHFVFRGKDGGGDHWRLLYMNGTTDSSGTTTWGPPQLLASTADGASDAIGYSAYDATLAVDENDMVHLAYQMYKLTTGAARSWGYLRRLPAGQWQDWNGTDVTAILPIDTSLAKRVHLVGWSSIMDVRVCNIAIDKNGDPWVGVCYLAPPGKPMLGGYNTLLFRLSGGQWSTISLSPVMVGAFGATWRAAPASITFDAKGVLYVAADRVEMGDPTGDAWFAGRSKEVALLVSTDLGQTFQVYPVSSVDANRPHWLANIERPTTAARPEVPALMYTDCPLLSVAAGTTAKPGDVIFVPLYKY